MVQLQLLILYSSVMQVANSHAPMGLALNYQNGVMTRLIALTDQMKLTALLSLWMSHNTGNLMYQSHPMDLKSLTLVST